MPLKKLNPQLNFKKITPTGLVLFKRQIKTKLPTYFSCFIGFMMTHRCKRQQALRGFGGNHISAVDKDA